MIGRLTGVLLEKNPPQVLVDVGGVGYEVEVPMSSFYNLPETGAKVTLLTQFVVREDAQLLYGFLTQKERLAFRQLIKVSGIGAKSALGILSGLSVDDLSQAIAAQDIALLVRIPGIGKKPPNVCCWNCATNSALAAAYRPCLPTPTTYSMHCWRLATTTAKHSPPVSLFRLERVFLKASAWR